MTSRSGDRAAFFPAIEKKHGKPIKHWFSVLDRLKSDKYADQLSLLVDKHGFSRNHANAVVMYHRGSTSSQRVLGPDSYFQGLGPSHRKTAQAIFGTIQKKYPDLELVVAWNQPMLRNENGYVFGLSAAKNHLTLNPWSTDALEMAASKLKNYTVNKKTFQVPSDWEIDSSLLIALVKTRLKELK